MLHFAVIYTVEIVINNYNHFFVMAIKQGNGAARTTAREGLTGAKIAPKQNRTVRY